MDITGELGLFSEDQAHHNGDGEDEYDDPKKDRSRVYPYNDPSRLNEGDERDRER